MELVKLEDVQGLLDALISNQVEKWQVAPPIMESDNGTKWLMLANEDEDMREDVTLG